MELNIATIHLESLAERQEITLLELLVDIRKNPEDYSVGIINCFNTFIQPADEFFGEGRGVPV